MSRVAIVGAGMMGSAMAWPLSDNGHHVRLVGTHLDRDIVQSCRRNGWHPTLSRPLPPRVTPFFLEDIEIALQGVEFVIQGVSSPGVPWAAAMLGRCLTPGVPVLAVTKGLALTNQGELQTLPDLFDSLLPDRLRGRVPLAAIAGPCIAGELAGRRPSCVVFAGRDADLLHRLAANLQTDAYRVWTSLDVAGVETCAALKNSYVLGISLAMGLLEAQGGVDGAGAHSYNLEAALFAQASLEIRRMVALMGGNPDLAAGLPGVGDLYVTTRGGRTVRLGTLLGQGLPLQQALLRLSGVTLESVENIRVMAPALPALERAGKLRAGELPLMRQLCRIVVEGAPVRLPLDEFYAAHGFSRPI